MRVDLGDHEAMARVLVIALLAPLSDALVTSAGSYYRTHAHACPKAALANVRLGATEAEMLQLMSELHTLRDFLEARSQADAVVRQRLQMAEKEVDILTTQLLEELQSSSALRAELADAQRELVALRAGRAGNGASDKLTTQELKFLSVR